MNKKDIDLVNSKISEISEGICKALEILQDLKKTNKHARIEAEKVLDDLLYEIPVFMEVK